MFTIWKITFFCDTTKKHFARIDFSSNNQNPEYILGINKDAENLKIYEKIETFCGVLENFLTKWDDYIQEKRQKNNFINFFTTKQLVLLQREIAKSFSEQIENIELELSQLLSLVQPSCTKKELLLAATKARQQLLKSHNAESDKIPENVFSEEDSLSSFVKALLKCGFPLSLAKAAEENVDSENIAKGWTTTISFSQIVYLFCNCLIRRFFHFIKFYFEYSTHFQVFRGAWPIKIVFNNLMNVWNKKKQKKNFFMTF